MTGSASVTLVAVARVRLMRKSARDSAARRVASFARSAWRAARRPIDDADEQQQEQIQPFLRIVHGQREPRFDEEGVVQQE